MRRLLVLVLLASLLVPFATQTRAEEFHAGQVVVVDLPSTSVRNQPSTTSVFVANLVQGDKLTILSDTPANAGGAVWWNVQVYESDVTGWLPAGAFSAYSPPDNAECWTDDQFTEVDGVSQWSEPPAVVIDQQATYIATITTTAGTIVLQLDAARAPIATNNFVCLANSGFYDGTEFHRVSSDFLIQGGDATGTGTGNPGYSVPSDPTTGSYPAGSVALANAIPGENGSQFFIAVTDLDGKIPNDYPVFGEVMTGQDIVAEISHAEVEPNPRGEQSQPVEPTSIVSIEIAEQEDEVGPPLPTTEEVPIAALVPSPTVEAAPTVSLPPADSTVIELDAKDIAFIPTEVTIDAANEPVTIRMKNTGAALHNFSIDSLGIDVDVNPGETVEFVIPAGTAPGTYDFYCNVPGHKEAGMVGKLIVESSASTGPQTGETACQGFTTYSSQYDEAFLDAFEANPSAVAFFELYEESDDWIETMTPIEMDAFQELFTDVASNLELVQAPEYARAWHRLQIETVQLFAELFQTAQTVGMTIASIGLTTKAEQLDREIRASLNEAQDCSAFFAWATEESFLIEGDLGPVSSAFVPIAGLPSIR